MEALPVIMSSYQQLRLKVVDVMLMTFFFVSFQFCDPGSNTCRLSNGQVYGCNNGYNVSLMLRISPVLSQVMLNETSSAKLMMVFVITSMALSFAASKDIVIRYVGVYDNVRSLVKVVDAD